VTTVVSPAARADLHALLRDWLRQQPPVRNLEEAERLATEIGQVAAECAFECGAEACGTRAGYGGTRLPCACGGSARFVGYRRRWVRGLPGEVGVTRAYYHCRACGAGQVPWDREQGLDAHLFTPALKARITEVCARVPYGEAAVMFERYLGLALAPSTLEAVTTAVGARLRGAEDAATRALFANHRFPAADPFLATAADQRLYLSLDAAKAHTQGDWHDIKVGACYVGIPAAARRPRAAARPRQRGAPRGDQAGKARYLAVQEEAERFGQRLYTWAVSLGCERARELVVLGDGAEWIWKLVRHHFSDAVEILDFYHASEHIWTIARTLFGEQDPVGVRWAERHCRRLEQCGPKPLLRALRALRRRGEQRGLAAAGAEALRLGLEYFTRHAARMDYPRYRAAGMLIGSGPVEAACKVVVGARLKRAGMRWSERGADAVLAARTTVLGGRYDQIARLARAA
jgi:hypothetical protein